MRPTMARHPRYPRDLKLEVIAYAEEHGAPAAAAKYEIHPPTVRSWCSRAQVATNGTEKTMRAVEAHKATMEERRVRLADRLLELAEMSAEHAGPLIAQASLRELVGAWDYAIKNSQLLAGHATARTEHGAEPEKVRAVADELAARRAKHAA